MKDRWTIICRIGAWLMAALVLTSSPGTSRGAESNDPAPRVVKPREKGGPPSDAIVLFDGKDLSQWTSDKGTVPTWTVADGVMTCVPKTGSIITKEKFGDVQLHVEFATPLMPEAKGQDRGNSGVYLQGRYEVQVLDSFESDTYHNGQCAAIYSEHAPLVNACRPPEQWQTYDIIFHAARFEASGKRTSPGRLTVFHNGVLVQEDATLGGSTTASLYKEAPGDGPIMLQDHWNTVKYRNVWLRKL